MIASQGLKVSLQLIIAIVLVVQPCYAASSCLSFLSNAPSASLRERGRILFPAAVHVELYVLRVFMPGAPRDNFVRALVF